MGEPAEQLTGASDRRKNAIQSLVELYTVVMGVALSIGVVTIVGSDGGLRGVTVPTLCLFGAFLATLFPFHHGALRHLWDAYLENSNHHIKPGAVFPDFVLLFCHALAFVVLALLTDKPGQFAWGLTGLLVIDIVWGVFVYFGASSRGDTSPELRWVGINAVFVFVALVYLFQTDTFLGEVQNPRKLSILLFLSALARTATDYWSCRAFYFPSK